MLWGASPPFLAMRNAARYGQAEGQTPQQQWLQSDTELAMQQTAFFKSRLTEHPVSGLLLADFIRQDSKQREYDAAHPRPRSIMASCEVGTVGVVCCATGENLSDLMITEVPDDITSKNRGIFPTAIAPLHSPIHQVALVGNSFGYGPSPVAHALVRSQFSLHHLRIEAATRAAPKGAATAAAARKASVFLDPVDRTIFPEEIISMGVARTPGPNAVVLTNLGNLFEWSPNFGAVRYSAGCLFDNLPYELTFFREAERTATFAEAHVECTLHPKIVLCSVNDALRQYDLRAPARTAATSSVLLYQSPESSGPLTSLCQHTSNPFHFYATTTRRMMQFDSRLPTRPVWIRPSLDEISDLKLHRIQRSPEVHVLMASGVHSRSIQLIALENSQPFDLHSAIIGSDTAPERMVHGFPVIDRDERAHLHGATLLPHRSDVSRYASSSASRKHRSNSLDSEADDAFEHDRKWGTAQSAAPSVDPELEFLLWHTNRHGDIFAQHLKYRHGMTPADLPDQAPIQTDVPSGIRCEVFPKTSTRMKWSTIDTLGDTHALPNPEASFMPYMDESSLKPVQKLPLIQDLQPPRKAPFGKMKRNDNLSVEMLLSEHEPSQTHAFELQQQLRQFLEFPRSLFELREWLEQNTPLTVGANDLLQTLKRHPGYKVSKLSTLTEIPSLLEAERRVDGSLYEDCCCTESDGQQACDLLTCANAHQTIIRSLDHCRFEPSHPDFESATTAPPSPPVYIPKDAKRRRNDLDEEMISLLQAEWPKETKSTGKRVSFGGPTILQQAASSSAQSTPHAKRPTQSQQSYSSWDADFSDGDF